MKGKYFETQLKTKELEVKLLEVKHNQELLKGESYLEQIGKLTLENKEMRDRIEHYSSAFEKFESALKTNKKSLTTLQSELKTKQTLLVNETKLSAELRQRILNVSLESKQVSEKYLSTLSELAKTTEQKKKLESLCRALQMRVKQSNSTQEEEEQQTQEKENKEEITREQGEEGLLKKLEVLEF